MEGESPRALAPTAKDHMTVTVSKDFSLWYL
jgi:hypothetical protein